MNNNAPTALRKATNFTLLLTGFGMGQGAMFVAQSILAISGNYTALALSGSNIALAILFTFIVEGGSTITISRLALSFFRGEVTEAEYREYYWASIAFRLTVATMIAAIIFILSRFTNNFTSNFFVCSIPGIVAAATTPGGIFDAMRRSGLSGLANCPVYLLTAGGLIVSAHLELPMAGIIMGSAYSIGTILSTCIQNGYLLYLGYFPDCSGFTSKKFKIALMDGSATLAGTLPNQLYYRAQLYICSMFAPTQITASLVYGKQISNSASQLVSFIRRVEYPYLLDEMSESRSRFLTSLKIGKIGLICAFIFTCGFALLSAVASIVFQFEIARGITVCSPLIITGAFYGLAAQCNFALGKYRAVAFVTAVGVGISIIMSIFAVQLWAVTGMVVVELSCHVFLAILLWTMIVIKKN